MPIDPQPMRCVLFVPGNREERMRKAVNFDVDGLIFDLEGATPAAELPKARGMVRGVLDEFGGKRPRLFVRVTSIAAGTTWDDLQAVVCDGLEGLLLPQVRGPEDVMTLDHMLTAIEKERGLPEGNIIIKPLLETAGAIRDAFNVAKASPRVAYMGGGASRRGDVVRAIGYRWSPEGTETLFMRSKVLLDSRAAGIAYPLSGVWGIIQDLDGLRKFAEAQRSLGYTGLLSIHPSHNPIIMEVFSPSREELLEWKAVVEAMEDAWSQGLGAVTFNGALIDEAHWHTGRQVLEHAKKLGIEV